MGACGSVLVETVTCGLCSDRVRGASELETHTPLLEEDMGGEGEREGDVQEHVDPDILTPEQIQLILEHQLALNVELDNQLAREEEDEALEEEAFVEASREALSPTKSDPRNMGRRGGRDGGDDDDDDEMTREMDRIVLQQETSGLLDLQYTSSPAKRQTTEDYAVDFLVSGSLNRRGDML